MTTANGELAWAPVAVFAYNRPRKLEAMVASLRNCDGFDQSPVTIFVDGPKHRNDAPAVEAVKRYVRNLNLPNVSYAFRESNRGLRNSIYAGVSEITRKRGKVIVFEDDLVLSPITLRYFNCALKRYEVENRIWSISGYIYDAPALRSHPATLALPFAHSWGWATWARAWDGFQLDNQPTGAELRSASFQSAFDLNGLYPFTSLLRNSIEGRVNSWYVHWYYTIFQHGGASIFPPRRVLDNFGFREGTHGGRLNPHERLVSRPQLLDAMPQFGNADDIDYRALDRLKSCREARVQRFIARSGSLKRRIRSMM